MAQSAGGGPTISQRISLEGGDEIKLQLTELGTAGEKAFQQIQTASDASGSRLGGFSSIISHVRGSITNVATSFTPVVHGFGELHESVNKFGESLTNVGEHVFPHFKEVVALGAAAGVAGLAEFVISGARAADELGKMAVATGVSISGFQDLRNVAIQSGVEAEKFTAGLFRFAGNVNKAADEQLSTFRDIGKQLYGDIQANGVAVLRGTQQAATGAADIVIRGGKAAHQSLITVAGQVAKTGEASKHVHEQTLQFATLLSTLLGQSGAEVHKTAVGIQQDLERTASGTGAAALKMREEMRKIGINFLPQTVGEALDATVQTFQSKLAGLVNLWKTEGGKIVPIGTEAAFRSLADSMHHLGNAGQVAEIVRQNFGRGMQGMVPVLMKGSEGIDDLATEFAKLGIKIGIADTEIGEHLIESVKRLEINMENARTIIAVALAPALQPFIEELTKLVTENAEIIRDWARRISNDVKPALMEFAHWLGGATKEAEIQSPVVRTLVSTWNGLKSAAVVLSSAIIGIASALDYVAVVVNRVFGTEFDGTSILAVLAVGKITGAFGLLTAAANVFLDTLGLIARIGTFFIKMAADAGLIRIAITGISAAFTGVPGAITGVGSAFAAMVVPILAAIGPVGWIVIGVAAAIAALITWQGAWGTLADYFSNVFSNMYGTLKAFIELINSAIEALARFVGAKADSNPFASGSGMASGGPIAGPGGIDRVPIWATAGEWVMRTAAVAKYGMGMMDAINSLRFPVIPSLASASISSMPPPSLQYAAGGPVMPTYVHENSAAVHLHIGGESFPMQTDQMTAGRLVSAATRAAALSTGAKPGWYGGGR